MAHLGYQPSHGLGANLQGTLHPIHEPYQMGKEGLGYLGNSKSWTPPTWTLKGHFVQGPLNPGESSEESFDSESLSESDSKSEDDPSGYLGAYISFRLAILTRSRIF